MVEPLPEPLEPARQWVEMPHLGDVREPGGLTLTGRAQPEEAPVAQPELDAGRTRQAERRDATPRDPPGEGWLELAERQLANNRPDPVRAHNKVVVAGPAIGEPDPEARSCPPRALIAAMEVPSRHGTERAPATSTLPLSPSPPCPASSCGPPPGNRAVGSALIQAPSRASARPSAIPCWKSNHRLKSESPSLSAHSRCCLRLGLALACHSCGHRCLPPTRVSAVGGSFGVGLNGRASPVEPRGSGSALLPLLCGRWAARRAGVGTSARHWSGRVRLGVGLLGGWD